MSRIVLGLNCGTVIGMPQCVELRETWPIAFRDTAACARRVPRRMCQNIPTIDCLFIDHRNSLQQMTDSAGALILHLVLDL